MANAQDLLTAVHAEIPSITGMTIRDPADADTWTFYGEDVTQAEAARAVAIITAAFAPPLSSAVLAQRAVDGWPLEMRALVLVLVDVVNVIRGKLVPPLPPVTEQQVIAAIRAKVGTL